jgi:hypothetical protein
VFIYPLVPSVVFLLMIAISSQPILAQEFLTFENSYPIQMKIKYPEDWIYSKQKIHTDNMVSFYPIEITSTIDENTEYGVWVTVGRERPEQLPVKNVTLDTYVNENAKFLDDFQNVNILESGYTTLDNGSLPAYRQISTFVIPNNETNGAVGFEVKNLEILFVKDAKPYFVQYITDLKQFDRYFSVAKKMFNSLNIIS